MTRSAGTPGGPPQGGGKDLGAGTGALAQTRSHEPSIGAAPGMAAASSSVWRNRALASS